MIKARPLNFVEYNSKNETDGHSLFLYELNIVNSKVNGTKQLVFNYNKNTINSMRSNAFVNFDLNFSSISIEYIEGSENFWEFLTYLVGLVGGLLSVVKIINNILGSLFFSKKSEEVEGMEMM